MKNNRPGLIMLIYGLFALVVMTASALAEGYQPLRVEPSRLTYELKSGDSINGTITVTNKGDREAVTVAVLSDWLIGREGQLEVLSPGSLSCSMSSWTKFNPKRFTIKPNTSQLVRFSIKVPQGCQPGERRGLLGFEQIIPYTEQGIGATAKIQVATTIYVSVGQVDRRYEVLGAGLTQSDTTEEPSVTLEVKGTGNGHFRGIGSFDVYRVLDSDKVEHVEEGKLALIIALPETSCRVYGKLKKKLDKGVYRIVFKILDESGVTQPTLVAYEFNVS